MNSALNRTTMNHTTCVVGVAFKDEALDGVTHGEGGEEQRLSVTREKPQENHVAKQSCTKEGAVSSVECLASSGAYTGDLGENKPMGAMEMGIRLEG